MAAVDAAGRCIEPMDGAGLCIVPVDGMDFCIKPGDGVTLCVKPADGMGFCILPIDGSAPGGLEFDQRELPLEARGRAASKGRGSGHLPLAHIWSRNGCTGLGTVPATPPWPFGRFHGVRSTKPGFAPPPGALPAS
jgi:hypothetical protein